MTARRGRPPACPESLLFEVVELRRAGHSYKQISDEMNAVGRRTPAGGATWVKSTVWELLHREWAKDTIAAYEARHYPGPAQPPR